MRICRRSTTVSTNRGYCAVMAQTPPCDDTALPERPTHLDGTPLRVGQFRFYFADELWEWSAEAAEIHGYPAVEMRPTTDQVMSHKHPEDYPKLAAALAEVRRTRIAVSTRHRIVDVQGAARDVVVFGQQLCDEDGVLSGTQGFYIDVTPPAPTATQSRALEQLVTDRIAEIAERRTVIDEVKGMLMLVYRIDDVRAFELLQWRSQVTNTKLRAFATQLRLDFARVQYDENLPSRSVFDQLLLTAHERLEP